MICNLINLKLTEKRNQTALSIEGEREEVWDFMNVQRTGRYMGALSKLKKQHYHIYWLINKTIST